MVKRRWKGVCSFGMAIGTFYLWVNFSPNPSPELLFYFEAGDARKEIFSVFPPGKQLTCNNNGPQWIMTFSTHRLYRFLPQWPWAWPCDFLEPMRHQQTRCQKRFDKCFELTFLEPQDHHARGSPLEERSPAITAEPKHWLIRQLTAVSWTQARLGRTAQSIPRVTEK